MEIRVKIDNNISRTPVAGEIFTFGDTGYLYLMTREYTAFQIGADNYLCLSYIQKQLSNNFHIFDTIEAY